MYSITVRFLVDICPLTMGFINQLMMRGHHSVPNGGLNESTLEEIGTGNKTNNYTAPVCVDI